jgi:hypothetical protein
MKSAVAFLKSFRLLLALAMALFLQSEIAEARVARYCLVSYETRQGWSEEKLHDVTFQTGRELNAATKSSRFDMFDKYALVWFAQDQVAIIRLSGFVIAGSEFSADNFRNMFLITDSVEGEQVNGNGERKWRLRAKQSFKFIDPRAERDEPNEQSPSVASPHPVPTPHVPPTHGPPPQPRRPIYVIPGCYAGDKPPPKDLKCKR